MIQALLFWLVIWLFGWLECSCWSKHCRSRHLRYCKLFLIGCKWYQSG